MRNRIFRRFIGVAVFLTATAAALAAVHFDVKLPTPREHYKTYNADKAAIELMGKVMKDLDPTTRKLVMKFLASGADTSKLPDIPPAQVQAMIKNLGLLKYKQDLLEIFLHKSQVLDTIPPDYRDMLLPIVHDALLAFMDGLSEDRLLERFSVMARLPKDTPRSKRILVFISKLPALQKLGQILARVNGIPPDIQKALQSLENGISTMTRDELVQAITNDVGKETIEKYKIRFADKILAEASVGAVIRASFVRPGENTRRDMVVKLIKPYVRTGLPEEMEIIDGLIKLAKDHAEFYHLQGIPLEELFTQIKEKLGEELKVTQEQANFRRAYKYYRGSKFVRVPVIYDISTKDVTFMEFFHGEKITDAFPGDQKKRSILARRLMNVMIFQTLFSKTPTAIFHGDPHAGNVMHLTDDPENPYMIGLIDWGLLGEFDRPHRTEMVQLALALQKKSKKKLHRNVGALLQNGLPQDPLKREEVFALADKCLTAKGTMMEIYGGLIEKLTTAGYVLDGNFSLYIKSQLTLAGIHKELDPSLNPDKFLNKKVGRQVLKEFPKRLLLLPAWHYRGYRSLLSNGDVFSRVF